VAFNTHTSDASSLETTVIHEWVHSYHCILWINMGQLYCDQIHSYTTILLLQGILWIVLTFAVTA